MHTPTSTGKMFIADKCRQRPLPLKSGCPHRACQSWLSNSTCQVQHKECWSEWPIILSYVFLGNRDVEVKGCKSRSMPNPEIQQTLHLLAEAAEWLYNLQTNIADVMFWKPRARSPWRFKVGIFFSRLFKRAIKCPSPMPNKNTTKKWVINSFKIPP